MKIKLHNSEEYINVGDLRRLISNLPDDYRLGFQSVCGHDYGVNFIVQDTTRKVLILKDKG